MKAVTQERLKELLHYSPETGVFTWRIARNQFVLPGTVAGSIDTYGHVQIMINGVGYAAHRLAWLYVYGSFPVQQIDHENRVRSDNRIENLRLATNKLNSENKNKYRNNKSGYKGVCWKRSMGAWVAQIKDSGRVHHLGYFDDPAIAHEAYVAAAKRLHTYHPK